MSSEFPNITNFRDLSYLTNKDGLHIKQNLLLRSSKLNEISPLEAKKLKDVYNLSYIVDLRNPVEARQNQIYMLPSRVMIISHFSLKSKWDFA